MSADRVEPITSGLINGTYAVYKGKPDAPDYLLQSINHDVFKHPDRLMTNHQVIHDHLHKSAYAMELPQWLINDKGKKLVSFEGRHWRLGTFFQDTQCHSVPCSADMAWQTGRAYGQYNKFLLDLDVASIDDTIIDFHNLQRYLDKLSLTLKQASSSRLETAKSLISSIDQYLYLCKLPFPKNRVIHNDAKISNLLFRNDEVHAVIDWDTTMAGHLSWEYADLFRSTAASVAEDHNELSELTLRYDMIEGLNTGYKSSLFDVITDSEKESFYHGAMYLILEQAIRFLEDYLAGDIYYNCQYDDHNYIRARNQFHLLTLMVKDEFAIKSSLQRS